MDYGHGSVQYLWLGGGCGGASCLYLYLSCTVNWSLVLAQLLAGTRAEQVIGQREHVNNTIDCFQCVKKKKIKNSRSKIRCVGSLSHYLHISRKRFNCGNIMARFMLNM